MREIRVVENRSRSIGPRSWFVTLRDSDDAIEEHRITGEFQSPKNAERSAYDKAIERIARDGRSTLIVTRRGAFVLSVGQYPQEEDR